jgi:hypothetical protein
VEGFLTWIESSALGHFVRESGPWTYAFVNLAHVLGIGTLFGSVVVLDLALIGAGWKMSRNSKSSAATGTSLPALAAAAPPVALAGFLLAAASGIGLLSSNATEYQGNPFFLIKFPAIALGVVNAVAIRQSAAWRAIGARDLAPREVRRLAWMGGASLICWIAAIAAGRMIGYW